MFSLRVEEVGQHVADDSSAFEWVLDVSNLGSIHVVGSPNTRLVEMLSTREVKVHGL